MFFCEEHGDEIWAINQAELEDAGGLNDTLAFLASWWLVGLALLIYLAIEGASGRELLLVAGFGLVVPFGVLVIGFIFLSPFAMIGALIGWMQRRLDRG